MNDSIRTLLLILVVILIVLVFIQSQYCGPIPNKGNVSLDNVQHFSVEDQVPITPALLPESTERKEYTRTKGLTNKESELEKNNSNKEREKVTSQIVDNILKNENNSSSELDSLLNQDEDSESDEDFSNPIDESVNTNTDHSESNSAVLDQLMKEVNTGNNLKVDSPEAQVYKKKSTSKNHAKKYRTLSYKDSGYRYDFNENGDPTKTSQGELNNMYKQSLVFKNNEYSNNDNYHGFSESNQTYGGADLKDFANNEPQTQQEKVMSLYNSNEYLPNSQMTNKSLSKGFQILDNPVAVSNPNLIPVLKSIPVPSIMGSNKNSTYDIRPEPPAPKTVVSPFLNSDIMPDIYATQRAAL